jgi:hypothetical protein
MTSGQMTVPDWYTIFRRRTPALAMGAPPRCIVTGGANPSPAEPSPQVGTGHPQCFEAPITQTLVSDHWLILQHCRRGRVALRYHARIDKALGLAPVIECGGRRWGEPRCSGHRFLKLSPAATLHNRKCQKWRASYTRRGASHHACPPVMLAYRFCESGIWLL